jgi:hypothetical protein
MRSHLDDASRWQGPAHRACHDGQNAVARLEEAFALSRAMLDLAERGVAGCDDDGCLVVYGIVRDCAYRIRRVVESELKTHAAVDASAGVSRAAAAGPA